MIWLTSQTPSRVAKCYNTYSWIVINQNRDESLQPNKHLNKFSIHIWYTVLSLFEKGFYIQYIQVEQNLCCFWLRKETYYSVGLSYLWRNCMRIQKTVHFPIPVMRCDVMQCYIEFGRFDWFVVLRQQTIPRLSITILLLWLGDYYLINRTTKIRPNLCLVLYVKPFNSG